MIDNLNLASDPFRNRLLPLTVSAVVACASLIALVLLVAEGRQANAQADAVERDLRGLRTEAEALNKRADEVQRTLTPQQLQTLEAAHDIIDRKRFSWSVLLANLEATLPQSVRVARISVRDVEARGLSTRNELELTVVGRTPDDITRMMAEMARTGVFSANLIREGVLTDSRETGTEAMLRVYYTPGAGTIALPPAVAAARDGAKLEVQSTPSTTPAATAATVRRPTTGAAR